MQTKRKQMTRDREETPEEMLMFIARNCPKSKFQKMKAANQV